jgi:uncharacterized protein YyaL (SSP411 family)
MQLKVPPIEDINQLPPDGGEKFNRLIFEKSPYLLQHAANPVDWYPWGEEAFQQASQQDKPLFLSIGYATCHWCHVMERESFENPQAAELINKNFIPIKVDREERPDIDNIYMSVCQAVTGTGGWPLTVLLTPDKKPFFVGTYFPRESRFGRTGLMELIPKVADLWVNKRNELLDSAEKITNHLWETSQNPRGNLDPGVVQQAFDQLRSRYDPVQGGFGAAPKFPSPHNLLFLTRFWKGTGDPNALEMVEKTLQEMRLGGIYDQIGFGFHRYSTDAAWRLPHFEKMLYDQAMLTMAYMEGYLATGKTEYAQVVREVLTYVLRDMTAPEGGFYSAEDADSEGEEGLFYLWTQEEFRENLGPEAAQLFSSVFNIEEEGNFADEATNNLTGRNLLYLKAPLEEHAERVNFESDDLARLWEEVRAHLFEVREQRVHPLKDDKILTDWNGLMIAALAKAGAGLGDPSYIQAASRAADFIWDQLRDEDGKLLKRYRDGEAGLSAHLDDYAFLIWGLLELYQAGFLTSHLERALLLTKIMIEDFWDEDKGGFFFTAKGQSDLILRGKEIYDGAIPSGNSVAYQNLIRLGRMLSRPDFEEKARSIGEAFSAQINQLPRGYTQLMVGILLAESPPCEVVISGNPDSPDTREMILRLRDLYLPNKVMMLRPADPDQRLFELVPVLREQIPIEERATAYVCRNYQCNAPTTDIEELLKLVENAE